MMTNKMKIRRKYFYSDCNRYKELRSTGIDPDSWLS